MSTDDLPDPIDYDFLLGLGHSDAQARWLLRHADRGTPDRPWLTPEEYEVALLDLQRHEGRGPA